MGDLSSWDTPEEMLGQAYKFFRGLNDPVKEARLKYLTEPAQALGERIGEEGILGLRTWEWGKPEYESFLTDMQGALMGTKEAIGLKADDARSLAESVLWGVKAGEQRRAERAGTGVSIAPAPEADKGPAIHPDQFVYPRPYTESQLEEPAAPESALRGGGRTITIPGPDLSTMPKPPMRKVPDVPPRSDIADALERMEALAPEAPAGRNIGSVLATLFGGWARGAAQYEGRGIGAQLAGAGGAGALAMENMQRYDAAEQRQYEAQLRQWEVQKLDIKTSLQLQQQVREDKASEIKFQNRVSGYKWKDQQWKARNPSPVISGGKVIVSKMNEDGTMSVTPISLDPIADAIEMWTKRAKLQEALGGFSGMKVMDMAGDLIEASSIPPQFRGAAVATTSTMLGYYRPDLRKLARERAATKMAEMNAVELGEDPTDKDVIADHRQAILSKVLTGRELDDEILGPMMIRLLNELYVEDSKLWHPLATDTPGPSLGGLLNAQ
jgi:hypothetical protein